MQKMAIFSPRRQALSNMISVDTQKVVFQDFALCCLPVASPSGEVLLCDAQIPH